MSVVYGRKSNHVLDEGPCGNTSVSGSELRETRRLFVQELPVATSGLSIVQRMAVATSNVVRTDGDDKRSPTTIAAQSVLIQTDTSSGLHKNKYDDKGGPLSMSQRVVNSHLEYFRKFIPFREGRFTKETMYEFLFFTVVENRVRMSYAKRVLRNLLSYARRYLEETGGGNARLIVATSHHRATGANVLEIKLTPESVSFFKNNPRGIVVQSKVFYRMINSIGDRTGNQRLKNLVCESRRPRDLVFSEQQNTMLLAFALRTLRLFIQKYLNRSTTIGSTVDLLPPMRDSDGAARIETVLNTLFSRSIAKNTPRRERDVDRALYEFCVAFLLGFLTGARIKSTVIKLTIAEIDSMVRGVTIEKLTKGSFSRVFIPECLVHTTDGRYQQAANKSDEQRSVVANLLYQTTLVRKDPLLYPVVPLCKHIGRGGKCGYGTYRQCRNKRSSQKDNTITGVLPSTRSAWADTDEEAPTQTGIVPDVYRAKGGVFSVSCPHGSVECEHTLRHYSQCSTNAALTELKQQQFFLCSGRQLDYTFDRIYVTLFDTPRPKGVFWHSQRRRYLGAVNEKFGAVAASKSVGHADVETTMLYINKSLHREDTNRKAGSAIYEDMVRRLGSL